MAGGYIQHDNKGKSDTDDLIFGFFVFPLMILTIMLVLYVVALYVRGL